MTSLKKFFFFSKIISVLFTYMLLDNNLGTYKDPQKVVKSKYYQFVYVFEFGGFTI